MEKKSPRKSNDFNLDITKKIPEYNGLNDKNLDGYFYSRNIRQILILTGVVIQCLYFQLN